MIARTVRALVAGGAVVCFYALAFALLTYPRIRQLSTHFWADWGDGFENVWNLWWVRTAVLELHQSPWHTTYLDYPFGISLHAHALGALNGFLAIPLSAFAGQVATHNLIIVLLFATSGLTAFLLVRALTGSAMAGLVGGWLFTFSAYHFAHAGSHLNLVAIEGIPLFLLCWVRLLASPGIGVALGAALALFVVYLCDYYYFAYSVLAALLLLAAEAYTRRDARFILRRDYRGPLAVFAVVCALTTGMMIAAWVRAYRTSPFVGGHDPRAVSLDLLAPFIPGGHSRFAAWTSWYWKAAGGNLNENSVYIGWGTIALMIASFTRRRRAPDANPPLGRWWLLLAVFAVLALGPRLHVFGREIPGVLLPYGWLDAVVPLLRLTGVPIRCFVIVTVAAAVLAAQGFRMLSSAGGPARVLAVALLVAAVLETLPAPIAATAPRPLFATTLAAAPDSGPLIDLTEPPLPAGVALYLQTIHHQPIAFGHTSRKTRDVVDGEKRLRALAAAGEYRALQCEYGFRWLLADPALELDGAATEVALWEPGRLGKLHDLRGRFGECPRR